MIAGLAVTWWRVCTRPWTAVFIREIPGKSTVRTLAGVTVGALLGLLLSWMAHRVAGDAHGGFMGLASVWVRSGAPPPFANWPVIVAGGIIVGFYDFEIVLFIFARLLGGRGSFGRQAYLQSLFYSPLAVLQQLLVVSPVFARPLFALAAVCSLIPTTTSLNAAHGYSTTRAVLTWVAPIVLNVVAVTAVVMLVSVRR